MTLTPTQPKKIYIRVEWTNQYSYDFTSKTKAQAESDWWVFGDNTIAIDSNGVYTTSNSNQHAAVWNLTTPATKTITLKTYFRTTSVWSLTGTIMPWFGYYDGSTYKAWSVYYWLMTNTNYKIRWEQQFWSEVASNSITWSANTWYIGTMTLSLESGWVTTSVATEADPNTAIVTVSKNASSSLSNITPMNFVRFYVEKDYTRVKRVEIERE